jgi:hypothetical protein
MPNSGNPILDQYDRDGIVTPGVQRALDIFKSKMPNAPSPLGQPSQPGLNPGILGTSSSDLSRGLAPMGPSATPSKGLVDLSSSGAPQAAAVNPQASAAQPQQSVHERELARLTAPAPADKSLVHTSANTGGSGIQQIHNSWLRNPLKVLDAIGAGFFPRLDAALPGTQLHHQGLVNLERANVNQEQKLQTEQATRGHLAAETNHENAAADAARNPKPTNEWIEGTQLSIDPEHPEIGPQVIQFNKNTGEHRYTGVKVAPKPESAREPREGQTPVANVDQLNKALESRYQVLNPGKALPDEFKIPANATKDDYDRIDKAMEATERAAGTKTNQDQVAELRRQTAAIAAGNKTDKNEHEIRAASFKAYGPAMDSAERFNVMAKNYEDAVQNHDQQAMLSLLANHLGMTMGLQKGARLTKDIIRDAEQSRPWLQGLQAKFDKDGYLSGVNLTPQQMDQMLNLGRDRFSEDIRKSGSEARYLGATDEGPERTINKSTANFYKKLAGGDVQKAKQMAAADGWTVK